MLLCNIYVINKVFINKVADSFVSFFFVKFNQVNPTPIIAALVITNWRMSTLAISI